MDFGLALIVAASFIAVAGFVFLVGQLVQSRAEIKRRLPVAGTVVGPGSPASRGGFGAFVAESFTEERYGVDNTLRQKLRRQLIRAGFFGQNAIQYYIFSRFITVIAFPTAIFATLELLLQTSFMLLIVSVMIAAGIGVIGPDAFLSRRHTKLMDQYRLIFPDLLDLLNVCISAGLSIESSFDRLRDQIGQRNRTLGRNIELMGAEMRAGRSTIDALTSFADRLGIAEAASFVAVLRHSIELGGDVASSLSVFAEEMRAKRMLLAEKKANELPVKMVLPLSLGIFPVILLLILLPIVVKMMTVMK